MKLDRSRPFAEIIGIVETKVRYQQDGFDFDGQGNQVLPERAIVKDVVTEPEVAEDRYLGPNSKNWSAKTTINYIKENFPDFIIPDDATTPELKIMLRNLCLDAD